MTSLTEIDAAATTAAATAGLGGELGNIRQNCPETTLEIGVFFDGTLNNRFNVLSRARQDDSYHNALYKDGPPTMNAMPVAVSRGASGRFMSRGSARPRDRATA